MFTKVFGSLSELFSTCVSHGNNQVLKTKAARWDLSAFFPANALVRAHTRGPCFTRLLWQPGAIEQRIQGQVYLQMRLPLLKNLLSRSGSPYIHNDDQLRTDSHHLRSDPIRSLNVLSSKHRARPAGCCSARVRLLCVHL